MIFISRNMIFVLCDHAFWFLPIASWVFPLDLSFFNRRPLQFVVDVVFKCLRQRSNELINWSPRYIWNIVESGAKHHQTNNNSYWHYISGWMPACYQCFIIRNETKKTHTCKITNGKHILSPLERCLFLLWWDMEALFGCGHCNTFT
jgi:hypothetical protein